MASSLLSRDSAFRSVGFSPLLSCSAAFFGSISRVQEKPFSSCATSSISLVSRRSIFIRSILTPSGGISGNYCTQSMATKEPVVSVEWHHANLRQPGVKVPLFDICPDKGKVSIPCPKTRAQPLSKKGPVKLITPEDDRLRSTKELRPGLVILKNYINHKDQVNIVKKCRELGLGPGGFYQPGYASGGKMNLQMMCLGKNWDPQTLYDDIRRYDGAKPPNVPDDFKMLVEKAIQDARDYLKTNIPGSVERRLPMMSPDICLVNFYSETGTLGFHQDKDETPESLKKGLPVVSFSFGDTCVFAYGDSWDACGEKVYLRSGDVLIFGGRSRMIYHGVRNILPRTAPPLLLEETRLRPGRLNLTFRQY